MNMPELVPENYQAIYDYFGSFEPNQHIQRLGFWLMHAAYRSDVHYRNGADEAIQQHLAAGGSIIVAPNHQSNADTPTIGSLIYEPAFAPIRGNVIAPGKTALFGWPVVGKLLRHLLVHPTFRSKDFTPDEKSQALRKEVTNRLIQFNIDHINSGGSLAIFAEASRNKAKPQEVQPLKSGLGRIAMGIEEPDRALIVPMGFAYRWSQLKLQPTIVVKDPFTPSGMTQPEVLSETRERIQSATTEAFELAA